MNEREYAISKDGIFAENEIMKLRLLKEEDLDGYLRVYISNDSSMEHNIRDEEDENWWKKMLFKTTNTEGSNNLHLSIIDGKTRRYMGELNMQEYKTEAPIIGITLLEEFRYQGIAELAIKLYMEECRKMRHIDYFVAKIKTDNFPSINMIKKLNSENVIQMGDVYGFKVYG